MCLTWTQNEDEPGASAASLKTKEDVTFLFPTIGTMQIAGLSDLTSHEKTLFFNHRNRVEFGSSLT